MMKFTYFTVILVTILFLAVYIIGYMAQPNYASSIEFSLESTPAFIWQQVLAISTIPKLKTDVESVDIVARSGERVAWRENLSNGGYRLYRITDFVQEKRLGIELLESSYGLTGVWIIELEPQQTKTNIILSEKSTLTNIFIRGMRTILGRNHDLFVWSKYIRVGAIQKLLITP
jgi:hypothetical protein